ncbi:hypothetical protein Bra3105_14955 [Brachybacterium halotolerans subsp. kimchii]|uniref:hypothetical protein n=1 Tax=Brachybacterium halotolerans TaxID=2795215 RepID=UPI001E651DAF|nr:hypothetical protein [Brachybacterium halotolerans]UEJ82125.1 hypothetical protein Bra3105_14955 [Brachybacterium halotolerans subsp. kimchii]
MPHAPADLPDALPRPVFTTHDARVAGVEPQRLRRRDVIRLRRGLYARTDALRAGRVTRWDVADAMLRLHPEAALVGLTAARAWGLPCPGDADMTGREPVDARWGIPTVHLGTPNAAHRASDDVVQWSRVPLQPWQIETVDEVRIATLVRTWTDLASVLDDVSLVVVTDRLRARITQDRFMEPTEPMVPDGALIWASGSGVHGAPKAATALMSSGTDRPSVLHSRLMRSGPAWGRVRLNIPLTGGDPDPSSPHYVRVLLRRAHAIWWADRVYAVFRKEPVCAPRCGDCARCTLPFVPRLLPVRIAHAPGLPGWLEVRIPEQVLVHDLGQVRFAVRNAVLDQRRAHRARMEQAESHIRSHTRRRILGSPGAAEELGWQPESEGGKA